jgi:hypothetical protein
MTPISPQAIEPDPLKTVTSVAVKSEVVVHLSTGDIVVKTMADGTILVNGDLVTPAKLPPTQRIP